MKKLALVLTMISALFVAAASPAEAHGWRGGWHGHWGGPGIGFGLVAGALTAGLAANAFYGPRYYGPPYGYYGPRFVRRAYYVPYAYAPPPYWDPWW